MSAAAEATPRERLRARRRAIDAPSMLDAHPLPGGREMSGCPHDARDIAAETRNDGRPR
jgi:hypothetical protein